MIYGVCRGHGLNLAVRREKDLLDREWGEVGHEGVKYMDLAISLCAILELRSDSTIKGEIHGPFRSWASTHHHSSHYGYLFGPQTQIKILNELNNLRRIPVVIETNLYHYEIG